MIELLDVLGNDLTVVNAARVSMDKRHDAFDQEIDVGLINYLAKHKHWTPFSHPQVSFRVTVPIFVARQWTRSVIGTKRTTNEEIERGVDIEAEPFSAFNEVSRRYVDSAPEFFVFERFRLRPEASIKQGSGSDAAPELDVICRDLQRAVEDIAQENYEWMVQRGIAPEQARAILPQTMMTQWIETGSLAFWARFCGLRLDEHAQKEIRDYAVKIARHMLTLFPVSWKALMEHGT